MCPYGQSVNLFKPHFPYLPERHGSEDRGWESQPGSLCRQSPGLYLACGSLNLLLFPFCTCIFSFKFFKKTGSPSPLRPFNSRSASPKCARGDANQGGTHSHSYAVGVAVGDVQSLSRAKGKPVRSLDSEQRVENMRADVGELVKL